MKPCLLTSRQALLVTAVAFGPILSASAADRTWSGASAVDSNWSTLENWDVVPVSGDWLIFATSTRTTPANNLAAGTSLAGISFNPGATAFTLGGNSVNLAGNITDEATNAEIINLPLVLTQGSTVTRTVAAGSLTLGGVISESASFGLTKEGAGNLVLNKHNSFTGGVTLNGGTLSLTSAAAGASPSGSGQITLNHGTTLNISGGPANTIIASNIDVPSGATVNLVKGASGGRINGNLTGSGTINESGNNNALHFHGNNTAFAGIINSGNNGGTHRWRFNAANTGSALAAWSLNTVTTDAYGFNFGTGTISFGSLAGGGSLRNDSTGTVTLRIGDLDTSTTFSGVIVDNGNSNFALLKTGSGTLTLSNNGNTYDGATSVEEGTLEVTGTSTNTPVTVAGTGTYKIVDGKTINALTINAGGTAKPGGSLSVTNAVSANGANATLDLVNGSSTSTLSVNGAAGLTLGGATGADTARLNLEVGGTASDLIAVLNGLTVDAGGAVITLTNLGVQANHDYTLATFFGGSGAGFATGSGTTVGAITLANPGIAFGVTGSLEITNDAIILHTSGATAPGEAYWSGARGSIWTDNSAGQGNFKTTAAGSTFLAANPGAATRVFFSSNGATSLTNTLGGNFDILGLTYRSSSAAVTTTGTHQLTLQGGILVESGNGGATLGMSSLALALDQTWTNNSTNPLTVSATTVSGPAANLTLAGTGTIRLGGNSLSVAGLAVGANLDLKGTSVTAALFDSSKNITNTGAANALITAPMDFPASLTGIISDSGPGAAIALTKTGAGTLTLGGANTYSGLTTLGGGTLQAANDSAFGSSQVSITSATGILDLNGQTIANELFNSGTGAVVTNTSATPATVFSGFNPTGAAATVISNFSIDGTGDILWEGAVHRTNTIGVVTKNGSNTVTINGTTVFNGMSLVVNSGTVIFGKTATSIQDLIINGGTLEMDPVYQVTTAAIWSGTVGNTVVMNGGTWDLNDTGLNGVSNRAKRINGTGGTITNNGVDTALLVLAARDGVANNPTWAGSIQDGTGKVAVSIVNGGSAGTTMTFSGSHTHSGATTIIDNTMRAGSATAFSPNSAYTLGNNENSKLELSGFNNSIGSLSGGPNSQVILGSATLTTGTDGTAATFNGNISGTGSVVKTGAGIQTFTGLNTYSGNTSVNAGTLSITHPYLADASVVTVLPAATLDLNFTGTDTISALTIDGASAASGTTWGRPGSGASNTSSSITGDGILLVQQGYSGWASAKGLTSGVNDGVNDDPDFDGIPNLLEYVFGGLPIGAGASNTSILPTRELTATHLELTFKRSELSKTDTALKVQWSTDLGIWGSPNEVVIGTASSGIVTVDPGTPASDPDTIKVAIPRANAVNGKLFARVLATKP